MGRVIKCSRCRIPVIFDFLRGGCGRGPLNPRNRMENSVFKNANGRRPLVILIVGRSLRYGPKPTNNVESHGWNTIVNTKTYYFVAFRPALSLNGSLRYLLRTTSRPTIGLARDFLAENVPGHSGPIRSVQIVCPLVTGPRTETRRFRKKCLRPPVPFSVDSRN